MFKSEDEATDPDPRSDILTSLTSDHGVEKVSNYSTNISKKLYINEVRDNAVAYFLHNEEV